jgi:twitching motility protein PilT
MRVYRAMLPASDGQSMVAAAEILPGSIALYTLIRDNKTFQIPSLQQRGRNAGMLRLDESLADLVRAGKTTLEYARAASEAPEELEAQLRAGGGIVATMVSSGGGGPSTKQGSAAAPAAAPPAGAPAARAPNPAAPAAASPAAPPVAPPGDKRAPAAGGGSLFQRAGSLFNKKEG